MASSDCKVMAIWNASLPRTKKQVRQLLECLVTMQIGLDYYTRLPVMQPQIMLCGAMNFFVLSNLL